MRDLYRRLIASGFDPWLDEEDLLPGQNWRHEIPNAVRACHVVIVCLSRGSLTKEGYLQKEIRFALDVEEEKPEGTIFIIPAKLEECDVPPSLGLWHWANLFQEGGYDRLVRALDSRAAQIGQVPSQFSRTDEGGQLTHKARGESEARDRAEAKRKAQEETREEAAAAIAKAEEERNARNAEEEHRKVEAERKAREEAETLERAEAEHKAEEEAEARRKAAAEQKAQEEAKARERADAERRATWKAER